MKKRVLSLVLVLCLVCSLLPVSALAAEVVDSGTCGENLTWELTDDGTLTISGTGAMWDYDASHAPWYSKQSSITSVALLDSVTSIGNSAFVWCESLESVTIPDGVTSIGESAFYGCKSLESVTIPDGVMSIGEGAFYGCSSLTSVTIGNGVDSLRGFSFSENPNLVTVVIGNSVMSIDENAFYGCKSLKSVTIGDSVSSIGNSAFKDCNSLTSVTIPDSVTNISAAAFANCTGLTNLTIPDSVTSIDEHAFAYCRSLTSVMIPDNVTSIGNSAFEGCSGLKSVTIGNRVTSIGESSFYGCKSLTSVTIPDSVTSIGNSAFYGCSSLTSVTIPESVMSIGNSAFYGCSSLTNVTIPDGVTSIGESAFYSCKSLTSVMISDGVTSIGSSAFVATAYYNNESNWTGDILYIGNHLIAAKFITSCEIREGTRVIGGNAFANCSSLTSVTIPDSVTSIGAGAFAECSSLTNLKIPDSVTSIGGYAFAECSSLTNLKIPDSVTSIGGYAFANCSGLTNLKIPDNMTSIGDYAFAECHSLESVTIPDSVTSIGAGAFVFCVSLTSVTIPDGVTSIGYNAFWCCSNLASVTIPNSVTSIGDSAFGGCSSLESVTIPDSVTSIGNSAFYGCSSLTSVTIPESVMSIGELAFLGCDNLENIYYGGANEEWNHIVISDGNDSLNRAIMHYNSTGPEVHIHSYIATVTTPTCTERGYTTYTCTCGDCYVADYVDALGHNWDDGVLTKDRTETEAAEVTYTCQCCGATKVVPISAESREIVSIDVQDVTLVENTNGALLTDYYYYSYTPEFTVTLSDGSVIKSQWGYVEIDGEHYYLTYTDTQSSETPWAVGSHEVIAKLNWATDTFTVHVIENPVESIFVEDMDVLEGIDGYSSGYWDDEAGEWVDHAWFQYHIYPDAITVNYKDGTSKTYSLSEISSLTNYYVNITSDQTYEHPWGVGTHTATAEYMGVSTEFQVTVKESPVTKLEVIKEPNKTTFLEGEYIDFKGAVLRAYYDDGSFEDIEFTDSTVARNIYLTYHSTHLNRDLTVSLSEESIYKAGTYAIELTYLNVSCTYDVEIVKSTVTEIEIQSPDQNTLVLHAKKSDGTAYDLKVLALDARMGDDTPEYAMQGGYMLTDQGCFQAEFYQLTDGSFYMEVGIGPEGAMLKSNVLQTCGWLDFQTLIDYYIYSIHYLHDNVFHFDGTITEENIDALAEMSLHYSRRINQEPKYEVQGDRLVYDGTAVQACILRVFNLSSVDLSLSKNYDPLTGEYARPGTGFGGDSFYKLPVDCIEQNGMRVVTAGLVNGETCQNLRMVLDESNRIQAFYLYADDHTHEYSEETVEPTCTEKGHTEFTCSVCGDHYVDYVDALGHTEVIDEAVAPTCAKAGLTEGSHCSVCGEVIVAQEAIPATGMHHHSDDAKTIAHKDATCTEDGYNTYRCSVCGLSYDEPIPASHHVAEADWIVTKGATCTEAGEESGVCTVCGESVTREIPATGHTVVMDEAVAPTCTEDGLTEGKHCSVCGKILVAQEVVPATGHSYENGVCQNCGASEPSFASGKCGDHAFWSLSENGVLTISGSGSIYDFDDACCAPWCMEVDGYESLIQSVIVEEGITAIGNYGFATLESVTKVSLPEGLLNIGHDAFGPSKFTEIDLPSTLKTIGAGAFLRVRLTSIVIPENVVSIGECAFPGSLRYITFEGDAPVCTPHPLSGNETATCKLLDGMTATAYFPAKNSTWTADVMQGYGGTITWVPYCVADHQSYSATVTAPTCTEEGYTTYTCPICGDSYVDKTVPALGHDFGEWKVTKPATCTEAGVETRTCTHEGCDAVETREIPATGHTVVVDEAVAPTCTEDGKTEGSHCSACGEVIVAQEAVPALGHSWDDGVVTTEPTATKDGIKTFTCTLCGETKTEAIPATGVCDGGEACPGHGFSDMPAAGNWAHAGIDYCITHNLMYGMSDSVFDPNGATTRAQLVTILWRQAGSPEATKDSAFADLTQNWYKAAVAWAAENNIVAGRDAAHFDPDAAISREEMAAILYRYAQNWLKLDMSKTADITTFPDYSAVSAYARPAMAWANAEEILHGTARQDGVYLDPQGNATRAQIALILMNFCENVAN